MLRTLIPFVLFFMTAMLGAAPRVNLANVCPLSSTAAAGNKAPKTSTEQTTGSKPEAKKAMTGQPGKCLRWWIREGFDPGAFARLGNNPVTLSADGWKEPGTIKLWATQFAGVDKGDFTTYSFLTFFDLPSELLSGGMQPGIRLGEIGEAFEIFINGKSVMKEGVVQDKRVVLHRTVRGVVYELNPRFLRKKNNQLLVKIQGDPRYDHTGFYLATGYEIGSYKELRNITRDRIGLVLISLYLFVGFYHLLLAFKRPRDRYNLFFGLFCVALFVYLATRTDTIFELPIDTVLIQHVELVVLYSCSILLATFIDYFFLEKVSWFVRVVIIAHVLLILGTLIAPIHIAERYLLRAWQPTLPITMGYMVFRAVQAVRRGNRDAWRLLFGMLIFVGTATYDVVDSLYLNTGFSSTRFGFSLFILGIAVILANRFMRIHNQVEELNANLEVKVKDRTMKLQQTLTEVQALKVQQDGDYFLTSLLIEPLVGDFSDSRVVDVDILERQKKQFEFRERKVAIGGDLCIAHNIRLMGVDYLVFMNGDAMGKSIQGAGGSLVLGTVFKALLARTQASPAQQAKHPERWLKECFIELQNVFVSFDGSMLISVVLGLVDERTGFVYYINAEHPWVTLYRHGKAEFIEAGTILRKIGIDGIDGDLFVKTFQMQQGDVLLIGSDGRDDILLGMDEQGHRIINEDENEFLRRTEEGDGQLHRIEEAILKTGSLTDDFTLLRIAYREDFPLEEKQENPEYRELVKKGRTLAREKQFDQAIARLEEARKLDDTDSDLFRDLARLYKSVKDFRNAARAAEICATLNPGDTDFLYFASVVLKLNGDLEQAADYGERVRLRQPTLVRNLVNLADVYRLGGNARRAGKITDLALAKEPENEKAIRLKEILSTGTNSPHY